MSSPRHRTPKLQLRWVRMQMAAFHVVFVIIALNVFSLYECWSKVLENVFTYVMCDRCENFTLCVECFMSNKYHHHQGHSFILKNSEPIRASPLFQEILGRLGPGRGFKHRAHCDECKQVNQHHIANVLIIGHCWSEAQMFQVQ